MGAVRTGHVPAMILFRALPELAPEFYLILAVAVFMPAIIYAVSQSPLRPGETAMARRILVAASATFCAVMAPCWLGIAASEVGEAVRVVRFRDAVRAATAGPFEVRTKTGAAAVGRALLRVENRSPSHTAPRESVRLEVVPAAGNPVVVRLAKDSLTPSDLWLYRTEGDQETYVGKVRSEALVAGLAEQWQVAEPPR